MRPLRAILDTLLGWRQYRALQDRHEALQDEHIALLKKQIEVTKEVIELQRALQELIDLVNTSMTLQRRLKQQTDEEKRLLRGLARLPLN